MRNTQSHAILANLKLVRLYMKFREGMEHKHSVARTAELDPLPPRRTGKCAVRWPMVPNETYSRARLVTGNTNNHQSTATNSSRPRRPAAAAPEWRKLHEGAYRSYRDNRYRKNHCSALGLCFGSCVHFSSRLKPWFEINLDPGTIFT